MGYKNIYEIFGLGRSGHHAMTNWLVKNMVGKELSFKGKSETLHRERLTYINEANLDEGTTMDYLKKEKENKFLILTYEDCRIGYCSLNKSYNFTSKFCFDYDFIDDNYSSERFIFIRNFFDNIASRNYKNTNEGGKFDVSKEYFFELWKQQAKSIIENNHKYLKYEDWITNGDIRQKFLMNVTNTHELYGTQVKGTKSSYGDNNFLNRFNEKDISEEIKDNILGDRELKHLIKELNYEYKL